MKKIKQRNPYQRMVIARELDLRTKSETIKKPKFSRKNKHKNKVIDIY